MSIARAQGRDRAMTASLPRDRAVTPNVERVELDTRAGLRIRGDRPALHAAFVSGLAPCFAPGLRPRAGAGRLQDSRQLTPSILLPLT